MKHEQMAEVIPIGGEDIAINQLPSQVRIDTEVGLAIAGNMKASIIHRAYDAERGMYEVRATRTPGGDLLAMMPDGGHYGRATEKINDMLAIRSSDNGATWSNPQIAFDIDYNQHGFIPLIPRGSQRIYAFGTQPVWDEARCSGMERGLHENAPIGFRYSDDDGYTWSDVELIEPQNDPGFRGMSVMRMCETETGTWLLGSHAADWSQKPLSTRQYVLRSEDRGKTWTVGPQPRPNGWFAQGFDRMDEGRPIALGGGEVMIMMRTPTGRLWLARSHDDGKSWGEPEPTSLMHPDAPPMLFHADDGQTLLAFHHNRHHDLDYSGLSATKTELMQDRSEVWLSVSKDGGHSWNEPRFVFANALAPTFENAFRNYGCSYIDAIVKGDVVRLFVPHRWARVVYLEINYGELLQMPTRKVLGL